MTGLVAGFTDNELRAESEWVATLPAPDAPSEPPDADRMAAGTQLSKDHRCASCHGAD